MIKSPHDYKGGNTCSICGYVNAADTYAVTVEVDGHGTAGASPAFAKTDETVTLTAIPDTVMLLRHGRLSVAALPLPMILLSCLPSCDRQGCFSGKTAAPVIS